MSTKRRRIEVESVQTRSKTKTETTPAKPLSAIAAARLKATQVSSVDGVQGVETPSSPLAKAPESEYEESELESEEDGHVLDIHQNFRLCSWRDDGQNILKDSDNELSVSLKKHSTISLIGCFDFKVTKGAININGANIGTRGQIAKTYRAFVPSTHPITKIRGLDGSNHIQFLICEEPTPFATISPLFADIWNARVKGDKKRSFDVITESDADSLKRPLTAEVTPEDWHRAVEDIASTPTSSSTVVLGASGKSTFARRLLNRYLTGFGKTAQPVSSVYYLDLDPSRPEYTPHGQISLLLVRDLNLGPSFTHPSPIPGQQARNETLRAHAISNASITNYEDYFTTCIDDLFQTYINHRHQHPSSPLVINTSGSLYTSHFPLLTQTLSRLKPTHTVYFGSPTSIDTLTASRLHTLSTLSPKLGTTIHELPSQEPQTPPSRTPTNLTTMQTLSYFHSTSPPPKSLHPTWDSRPLTALTPWEFSYRNSPTRTQDFLAVLNLHEWTSPSTLLTVLNGAIVHIVCTSAPPHAPIQHTARHGIPYYAKDESTGLVPMLDPRTSRLVCTALVRGVDLEAKVLQVVVPKSVEECMYGLEPERTVLVVGACELPEWAYVEDGYAGTGVGEENAPWVENRARVRGMGYLNTVRRVRKFL